MLDEHLYLTGGQEKVHMFELEGVKMGIIICYDLRFPELARNLMLEGVEVLHIVAEWQRRAKIIGSISNWHVQSKIKCMLYPVIVLAFIMMRNLLVLR